MLAGAKLVIDGQPAPKAGWGAFWLTRPDGSRVKARLAQGLMTWIPDVVVDKTRYPVGPKLPVVLAVIALLPFLLVFIGGALGGFCGAVGWGVNSKLARMSWPMVGKIAAMLAVTGAAAGTFLGLAAVFELAITFA